MTKSQHDKNAAQRSVLITGCSSGIGYASAHYLRSEGWQVFASCRKAEDCERLKREGFHAPRIDYDDEASVETGLAEVLSATGGRLDALFNNGAFASPGFLGSNVGKFEIVRSHEHFWTIWRAKIIRDCGLVVNM